MKKVSISLFAVLAIVFATTSAFTLSGKKAVNDFATRYIAFSVAPNTETSDPETAYNAAEDIIRNLNSTSVGSLANLIAEAETFYDVEDVSEVCEEPTSGSPLCVAEVQVQATGSTIDSFDQITYLLEGTLLQ